MCINIDTKQIKIDTWSSKGTLGRFVKNDTPVRNRVQCSLQGGGEERKRERYAMINGEAPDQMHFYALYNRHSSSPC